MFQVSSSTVTSLPLTTSSSSNMVKSQDSNTSKVSVVDDDSRKTFPSCLHTMLTQANSEGFDDIASWQPHGRSFRIHKPKEFMKSVMPKMFKQTKWSSFQRQLNLYGFKRITVGADKGAYYHEAFLRGNSSKASTIVRTRVKGTKVRMASNPDDIPNFYSMPPADAEPVETTTTNSLDSLLTMSSCLNTPCTLPLLPPQELAQQQQTQDSYDIMTQPQHLVTPPASRSPSMDMNTVDYIQQHQEQIQLEQEQPEVNDDDLRDLLRGMFGTSPCEEQTLMTAEPLQLEESLPSNDSAWGQLFDAVFD